MAVSKDVFHSTEMLASMDTVSSTIPKNVKRVLINYDSKCWSMLDQLSKNHLNSAGDGELCNCFVVSNELHLLVG